MTNVVPMVQAAADRFAEFWTLMPKKVGKPLAKAKWDAITGSGLRTRTLDRDSNTYVEIELRATPEEIIEGAKRYAKSLVDKDFRMTEMRYVLHPATFLNAGRWMDGA